MPNRSGRSKGTPTMSVLGQMPCRSGSPHGVFGGEYGAWATSATVDAAAATAAITVRSAFESHLCLRDAAHSSRLARPAIDSTPGRQASGVWHNRHAMKHLLAALVILSPLSLVAAGDAPNHPTGTAGLFLVDKLGAHVRFFDPATMQERSNLKLPANPHDFVFSPDHTLAYVPIYGSGRLRPQSRSAAPPVCDSTWPSARW